MLFISGIFHRQLVAFLIAAIIEQPLFPVGGRSFLLESLDSSYSQERSLSRRRYDGASYRRKRRISTSLLSSMLITVNTQLHSITIIPCSPYIMHVGYHMLVEVARVDFPQQIYNNNTRSEMLVAAISKSSLTIFHISLEIINNFSSCLRASTISRAYYHHVESNEISIGHLDEPSRAFFSIFPEIAFSSFDAHHYQT